MRLLVLVSSLCLGCSAAPSPVPHPDPTPDRGPVSHEAAPPPLPNTRDGFLAEVVPLPFPQLVVVYDVEGPAGIEGSLEVLLRAGGYRRENWSLTTRIDGRSVALRGSMVQTPDGAWTEDEAGNGQLVRSPLGPLADAYLGLDTERRAEVVTQLRRFYGSLSEAAPGRDTQTIAGQPCRVSRMSGHEICMWSATGLPLRYDGPGFRLRARHVDLSPNLGTGAFALPRHADSGPDSGAAGLPDPAKTLHELASGQSVSLAAIVAPGLRLPDPSTLASTVR